ncbi:MAG: hypothetical protein HYX94_12175 [Chloroflexi bacterium]|nr:hypothetical protein [Chloroflexota bacterium]
MIVRISTEGQYRLKSSYLDKLNEIDNKLVSIVAKGDEKEFRKLFTRMIALVKEKGTPVEPADLASSDVVLPPPDTSLAEAKELFAGEGLIPG